VYHRNYNIAAKCSLFQISKTPLIKQDGEMV